MAYVVSLPSGSVILVHPPEWDGSVRKNGPVGDILYFMEVRRPSGSGYVYSRDRDECAGEFSDFNAFCDELVREGYVGPGDVPAVVEFLEVDPESVSSAASVILS